jgi:hypothetical protein
MKWNPQDLEKIAHLTLEHYNQYAEEFWQGTRDHDVSQNIAECRGHGDNSRCAPPFSAPEPCAPPAAFDHEFDELGWLGGAFDV